jgi:hypothetical protein
LELLKSLVLGHCQFAGACRSRDGLLQLPDNVRRHGIIGYPPISRFNPGSDQKALRLRFILGLSHLQGFNQLYGEITLADQRLRDLRQIRGRLLRL